ncbi:hypothetical protein [Ktedonobacter racemifer]|uniref:Uncharacterized protein n=1 Tax=Ktedonobacter racemifer DSM 44963 TaxID=485913 RepID=D6U1R0_KTERA|nr:hypothetical protein [Ktedonobacter racemifer]EFH82704.1 hypothetical protein Krac_3542 [Ktedonobacter racemifer DSM 44963]
MAQFDQRGQKITGSQYNAGRDINWGTVQSPVDLVSELEKLKEEVNQAQQNSLLDKKKATDVEYQITKAIQEAEESHPDKKTIVDHLKTAKSFLDGIATVGGLITTIAGAIEAVQKLFS